MSTVKPIKNDINKTVCKLRKILMQDLKDFRKGKLTCKQAQTVARLSDAVMRTMCV